MKQRGVIRVMEISFKSVLECSLAFLALINPVSKMFLLFSLPGRNRFDSKLVPVCVKSSVAAAVILLSFLVLGVGLFKHVFQVDIYSLKIAGGLVLLSKGFLALDKGVFYEIRYKQKLEDLSIVPLASPMIAGPASITAAVSFPASYGFWVTVIALMVAIFVNLMVMLSSKYIGHMLVKHNTISALIRITGLVVATIGIQMMLSGILDYSKLFYR
ncbi:MAG TPA: MarC family protein [Candidatus Omnitrophota bacterium]|nr:MarC family protein [Candidatus Omnitrophota bacterium]HPS20973.1 MarC family protein [Candidatus Omnitrophota bacterium]